MMKKLFSQNGVSLLELMIATLMVGLVFAVAMSLYTSGVTSLSVQGASTDPTRNPLVVIEDMAKRISACNDATVTDAGTALHVRCDYNAGSYISRDEPETTVGDTYWHFCFSGGALYVLTNGVLATPTATIITGALLVPNVNVASSGFTLTSASGIGTASTKVNITLKTSVAPINDIRTSAFLGAKATR